MTMPAQDSRLSRILLVVLLACAAGLSVAFCFWSFRSIGLAAPTADLLAAYRPAGGRAAPAPLAGGLWSAPLTGAILSWCASRSGIAMMPRWMFWALSMWNLALLAAIARRARVRTAVVWVLLLTVPAAVWLMRSSRIEPAVLATWSVLVVQWAFGRVWPAATLPGLSIYAVATAAAACASPCAVLVAAVHALWLGGAQLVALARKRAVSGAAIGAAAWCVILVAGVAVFTGALRIEPHWPAALRQVGGSMIAACAGTWGTGESAVFAFRAALGIVWLALACAILAARRGEVRVWLACLALGVPFWAICAGGRIGQGLFDPAAHLWPFLLLCCGTGIAVAMETVWAATCPVTRRYVAGACRILVVGAGCAVAGLWLWAQVYLWMAALGDSSTRDLAAPVRFLRTALRHNDTFATLCVGDVRHDRYARYYLSEFAYRTCPVRFMETTPAEWTSSVPVTSAAGGRVLVAGMEPPRTVIEAAGLTNIVFPFTPVVVALLPTSAWPRIEELNLHRLAMKAAPFSERFVSRMLDWYCTARNTELCETLRNNLACSDLAMPALPPSLRARRRHAANRVLYAWGAQCLADSSTMAGTYDEFHAFVRTLWRAGLDRERTVYIHRLYIEDALLASNTVRAASILAHARRLEPRDPYLDRIEAQLVTRQTPGDLARITKLNTRADKRYRARFGRPYIEALFANALIEREHGNDLAAIAQCKTVLRYVQQYCPQPGTDATDTAASASRHWWEESRLFWEAQCNSYIALMLLNKGDYPQAIEWQSKNLDPQFDDVRHQVAQERLTRMYIDAGEMRKALERLDALANGTTSVSQRVNWILQAAQLNVTYGEAVAAYDQLTTITKLVATLPETERLAWTKDKKLQRLIRYIERRHDIDMRDAVVTALRARAQKDAGRRAWYFRQIAQIDRCRLLYDRAEQAFAEAFRAAPGDPETCLDAAMLQFRRLKYAQAHALLSNSFITASATNLWTPFATDWRFCFLSAFERQGTPPTLDSLLSRAAANSNAFADPARYHQCRGNIFASFDRFAEATNEFSLGIATNSLYVGNYLDLGALISTRADADQAGALLDTITALPLAAEVRSGLEGDWRLVELYHVSIRPYTLEH